MHSYIKLNEMPLNDFYLRHDEGFVFIVVCLCLSVCLSVCQQHYGKTAERMFMKFSG